MIDDNYYREREQECDLEFIVLQSLSLTYMYQDQNEDVMRCYKKFHQSRKHYEILCCNYLAYLDIDK